jgi:selenocysteine-specific elongation factor
VVVLTTVDLVDDEGLQIAELDVADHLAGTFLGDAPRLAVSATTGRGLDELRAALDAVVADTVAPDRRRPRLWIDRVFSPKGSGTVVTGTLAGGSLRADQQVAIAPGHRAARVRGLQTAGRAVDTVGPGTRVAVNLSGVDHRDVGRGDAVVEPDRWLLTDRIDASLEVLSAVDHEVSRRGAYVAYIGSGEHPVRLRVLGGTTIEPGGAGSVRLFLPRPLPLLPGDRYVLRESGRDETVGGGEVLDIAPVVRAARATPDRSVERVVRERGGWVTADELERLTGVEVEPVIGGWVTTDDDVAAMAGAIEDAVAAAGPAGVDLASFDERQRAVLDTLSGVIVDGGLVRPAGAADPFADHPFLAALRAGGYTPPAADTVDRGDLRELIRRGHAVQRDGVVFHAATIDDAAAEAARLLAATPDGFTVAEYRDATGASRKFVLPLLAELDRRGVTRRRGDLRIAGPRLPAVG